MEIPKGIFEWVSALCLTLPEVTVRVDASRIQARSTAHSFDIRRRSFCLLIALEGADGTAIRSSCYVPTQPIVRRCCPLVTPSTALEAATIG